MKKLLLMIVVLYPMFISAQKLQEADFIGNVRAFDPNDKDSVAIPLDRAACELVGKATGSRIWWGIGSTRIHIKIPGKQSNCTLKQHSNYQLIVRVSNNNYDPLSQVTIFPISSSGSNSRRAELGKVEKFVGNFNPSTIPDAVQFEGKKYGNYSYIIDPHDLPKGEYAVFVSNPEQANSTSLIIYTFRVN